MSGFYSRDPNFFWNGCTGQVVIAVIGLIIAIITNYGFILLGLIGFWILISYISEKSNNEEIKSEPPKADIQKIQKKQKTPNDLFDENVEQLLKNNEFSDRLKKIENIKKIRIDEMHFEIRADKIQGYACFKTTKNTREITRNFDYRTLSKSMAVMTVQLLNYND